MHCTHSCGSLVKQFPISNEPDLTIYPRKHCRKQDAAAGGPGGCDDIASYFFPRNRVYIHLYLTPCPISSDRPRTLCRARKMLARTPMCHKVWHIWYVCHKCHKCGTKCGTAQAAHLRPPLIKPLALLRPGVRSKDQGVRSKEHVPQSVAHLICVPQVPQMWHSSGRPPQARLLHHTRWYCIILFPTLLTVIPCWPASESV